jgi:hypothetical protein
VWGHAGVWPLSGHRVSHFRPHWRILGHTQSRNSLRINVPSVAPHLHSINPMSGYHDERYGVAVRVRVTWRDGASHVDEVKGLNVGHALYRARLNWPEALVMVLGKVGA